MRLPVRAVRPRAFTLVELMLTVVVMGVLGSLLYVGQASIEQRRRSTAADAAIGAVLVAQQELASQFQTYTSFPQDVPLSGVDAQLSTNGISHGLQEVSIAVGTQGSLGVAVRLSADECRVVRADPAGEGGSQVRVDVDAAQPCRAQLAFTGTETLATQVAPVRAP